MDNLKNHIEKALKKYASLSSNVSNGITFVEGIFTAYDKTSKTKIDNYSLLISFPKKYPYAFPLVRETSEKIPKDLSRHVNANGTLCFANWQDELSTCRNGITFIWFLDEILNTHLCREFVREKTGKYPTGERSHGIEGIWEGFYDILSTTHKSEVLEELELILFHNRIGRNTLCYCNNGKRYKACHEKVECEINKIGRTNAKKMLELLKTDFKNKKSYANESIPI